MRYIVYNNNEIIENLKDLSNFYVPIYKKDEYREAIKNSDYIVAAVGDKKILGALRVITDNHRFALLVDFVVSEDQRRKGIGKEIMNTALNFLKEKGVARINLNTDPRNSWLVEYYSKMGFAKNGGVYMVYEDKVDSKELEK